jgi:ppGpp synthetase/RelA/SpoT-type nucleotidyltranferase
MFRAQTVLTELGLDATSRLKTTNTIIEKLRRERTRLARDRI